jgi:hypothetical protein
MQEGVWNSESLGRFVNFLRMVEEDGDDADGLVPASKRVSWVGSSVSPREKVAQIRYAHRNGDVQESVKMSDDYVTWRGDGYNVG